MNETLLNLPLGIQIALAGGWLGYRTAYAGLDERHSTADRIMSVFVFGVPAMLITAPAAPLSPWLMILVAPIALAACVGVGILWRKRLRGWVHKKFQAFRVHRDDGLSSAWTALIHEDGEVVNASVELKSGRKLFTGERWDLLEEPWAGLNLGSDGSVVMIVQKVQEKDADGPVAVDRAVDDFGARFTYIPASEIATFNMRLKKD